MDRSHREITEVVGSGWPALDDAFIRDGDAPAEKLACDATRLHGIAPGPRLPS